MVTPRASRGRQLFLAISLGTLCLATTAWLGHELWRVWLENWYIAKLAAEDPGEREAAVAKLTSLGSARAVPGIIESIARSPGDVHPPGRGESCGNAYDEFEATWQGKCSEAIDAAGVDALPHLRAKLRAGNATERYWAAYQIGALGTWARAATRELLPVLADPDPGVRSAAAEAIAATGWRETDALASLRDLVRSAAGPEDRRVAAAEALGAAAWRALRYFEWACEVEKGEDTLEDFLAATGSPPAAMRKEALEAVSVGVQALVEAARGGATSVRRAAASALQEVWMKQQTCEGLPGDGAPDLVPVFTALARDDDAVVRALAVGGLRDDVGDDGLGEAVLQALAGALKDGDPEVRKVAAHSLWRKEEAVAILPALAAALQDPEEDVRSSVASTLGAIGAPAVPFLIRVLKEDHLPARSAACGVLGEIGSGAREAWARLFELLADGREEINLRAAAALGTIGAAAGMGVPELTSALKSPDRLVRRGAADALGHYGEQAAAAGPALLAALDDQDPAVQAEALLSLSAVGGVPREPFQAKVLSLLGNARTADVRYGAAVAVRHLARTCADAVPLLIPCLADPDPSVRWSAARALGAIGPAARAAVPALIRALEDTHDDVNLCAITALGRIGPDARDAVPVLLSRLGGEKNAFLRETIVALGAIGEQPDQVVPALRRLLLDSDIGFTEYTAVALAAFGENALPALGELLKSKFPYDRMAAARALQQMGPRARALLPLLEKTLESDADQWVRKAVEKSIAAIAPVPAEGSPQAEPGR